MAEMDGGAQEDIIEQLAGVHQLARRGAEAAGRQAEAPPVRAYPEVEGAVREVQHSLEGQDAALAGRLAALGRPAESEPGGDPAAPPAGAERAAAAIEGDRAHLQHLSLEYQRLEAAGRAQGDGESADLAGRGYEDTQRLIREQLGRVAPRAARADRPRPSMNPPGVAQEGGRLPMPCPACRQPGTAAGSIGGTGLLFACETPDCPVQTFDAEGAQSLESPESPGAGAVEGDRGGP